MPLLFIQDINASRSFPSRLPAFGKWAMCFFEIRTKCWLLDSLFKLTGQFSTERWWWKDVMSTHNVIHFPTTCGVETLETKSWKWNWVPLLKTVAQASRCLPYEHVSAHVAWPLLNPWFLLVFHYNNICSYRCTCCSKWLAIIPANHQERAPFPSLKKKIQEENPAHWQYNYACLCSGRQGFLPKQRNIHKSEVWSLKNFWSLLYVSPPFFWEGSPVNMDHDKTEGSGRDHGININIFLWPPQTQVGQKWHL